MDDAPSPSFSARQMSLADSLAQLDAASTGSEEDDDSDVDDAPAPFLSRGKYRTGATLNSLGGGSAQAQHLHPFHRSTTSPVDEKVDDWVRTSRHRLLADVSVGAAPGLCRALTVYKPLSIFGGRESGDDDEEDDGREAGGDPTPSPRASGNGGGEGVAFSSSADSSGVSTKRTLSVTGWGSGNESGNDVQTPGIGSSEAAATAGGGRNRSHKQFIFGVGSEGRAVQTGGGSAHSAADDAAGRMEDVGESVGAGVVSSMQDLDAMDMVSPADDDSMGLLRDSPIQPALTRVGTSRGVPTPELTPEWAALARVRSAFNYSRGRKKVPEAYGRRGYMSFVKVSLTISRGKATFVGIVPEAYGRRGYTLFT